MAELVIPQMIQYLHAKAGKNQVPLAGTFELTPMCNMDCKMCYVKMTPEDIAASGGRLRTVEEWLALAKEAQERGMLFLLLTGGEPFLYPDFRKLYTELKKLGLMITINSNGTMITEEVVDFLKKDPPMRINLTLYGASNETYARLCGNPNGYTQAVRAVGMLRDAGIHVKLNCSVTPYNRKDVPEIFAFAKNLGLVVQFSSYMFPPLRRDEEKIGDNDRFTPEEAASQTAEIVCMEHGSEWFEEHLALLHSRQAATQEEEDCFRAEGGKVKCRAGRSSFWAAWDGRMLACGMMNQPVAHPFSDGFQKAWQEILQKTEEIRLPGKCASCKDADECQSCAAMVLTETGSFHETPEYRCKMQRAYLPACEALMKEIREKENEKEN